MAKTDQNFDMIAGNTVEMSFSLTDASDDSALDVSGYTMQWILRPERDRRTVSLTIPHASFDMSAAATGTVGFDLIPANTASLASRVYEHELQGVDGSGNTVSFATGRMALKRSIDPDFGVPAS